MVGVLTSSVRSDARGVLTLNVSAGKRLFVQHGRVREAGRKLANVGLQTQGAHCEVTSRHAALMRPENVAASFFV